MTLSYSSSHLHPPLAKFIDDVVHYERWRLYHARASDETYPASMPIGTSLEVMVDTTPASVYLRSSCVVSSSICSDDGSADSGGCIR